MRECVKQGCRQVAAATAAARYAQRVLWISDLLPQRDPNLFDLCQDHANRLTAPYGWTREDERERARLEPVPPPVSLATGSALAG